MVGEALTPLRSALYMPATNIRALEKARTLEADAYIFDLEDAVASDAKALARTQACEAIDTGGYGRATVVMRINAVGSAWFEDDVAAVAHAKPDAVLLAKTNGAGDVAALARALAANGAPDHLKIWCMIETPLAVLRAGDIATANDRVTCFVLGLEDLAQALNAKPDQSRSQLGYAMQRCLLTAKAYGLSILDGVHAHLADNAEFEATCSAARSLGFDGKSLIHPSQIGPANRIFAPSETEVAHAHAVVEAFNAAAAKGEAVALLNDQMIESLHVEAARRTLAMAQACT